MTQPPSLDPADILAQGHSLRQWSDAIAASTPAPGGGAAVAIAASLAASLLVMCIGLTTGRRRFAEVESEFTALRAAIDELRENLILLAEEDVVAYTAVAAARALPHATEDETVLRLINLNAALMGASDVQLAVLRLCSDLAEAARRVLDAGNPSVRADAHAALLLAAGAGRAAEVNVRANLSSIEEPAERIPATAEADDGLSPEIIQEALEEAAQLVGRLGASEKPPRISGS